MPWRKSSGFRHLRVPRSRISFVSSSKQNRALEVTTRQGPDPAGSPARSLYSGPLQTIKGKICPKPALKGGIPHPGQFNVSQHVKKLFVGAANFMEEIMYRP
jgi:hypothetical protein